MSNGLLKIIISVALIGGSLTYLLSTSLSEQIEYFHGADYVACNKDKLVGQRFRMGGFAESVAHKPGTTLYWFKVRPVERMMKSPECKEARIPVTFDGVVPDTFKEDGEVIVTGTFGADGVFVGTDLLAKCPSKEYEAMESQKGGES